MIRNEGLSPRFLLLSIEYKKHFILISSSFGFSLIFESSSFFSLSFYLLCDILVVTYCNRNVI